MSDVSYVYTSYTSNRTQPYLQYIKNNSTSYKRVKSNPIVSSMVAFPQKLPPERPTLPVFYGPCCNGPMARTPQRPDEHREHHIRHFSPSQIKFSSPEGTQTKFGTSGWVFGGWTEGKSGSPPPKKNNQQKERVCLPQFWDEIFSSQVCFPEIDLWGILPTLEILNLPGHFVVSQHSSSTWTLTFGQNSTQICAQIITCQQPARP